MESYFILAFVLNCKDVDLKSGSKGGVSDELAKAFCISFDWLRFRGLYSTLYCPAREFLEVLSQIVIKGRRVPSIDNEFSEISPFNLINSTRTSWECHLGKQNSIFYSKKFQLQQDFQYPQNLKLIQLNRYEISQKLLKFILKGQRIFFKHPPNSICYFHLSPLNKKSFYFIFHSKTKGKLKIFTKKSD